jgi:hypothetical protein
MSVRRYGDGRLYKQPGSKNYWVEYWVDGVVVYTRRHAPSIALCLQAGALASKAYLIL